MTLFYNLILQLGLVMALPLPHGDETGHGFNTPNDGADGRIKETVLTKGKTTSQMLGSNYTHDQPIENDEQTDDEFECSEPLEESRSGLKDEKYRWYPADTTRQNPWLPIIFSDSYTPPEQGTFMDALKEIESKTCFRFSYYYSSSDVPTADYIEVTNTMEGCFSTNIGRRGIGRQVINLSRTSDRGKCTKKGVILHEIMHAMGFVHEESIPDRDRFIQIFFENITPEDYFHFVKDSNDNINSFGVPYDLESVMHSNKEAFSKTGKPTLQAKTNTKYKFGQRLGLSKGDVVKINKMYKCP